MILCTANQAFDEEVKKKKKLWKTEDKSVTCMQRITLQTHTNIQTKCPVT